MLRRLRRRSALRKMRRTLGPELRRRYGPQSSYTPAQVDRTYGDCGGSPEWKPYAYAMYCDERNYGTRGQASPYTEQSTPTYREARDAISEDLFDGASHFTTQDVMDGGPIGMDAAPVDGGSDGGSDGGGDGGSDGGGDGGGGGGGD